MLVGSVSVLQCVVAVCCRELQFVEPIGILLNMRVVSVCVAVCCCSLLLQSVAVCCNVFSR